MVASMVFRVSSFAFMQALHSLAQASDGAARECSGICAVAVDDAVKGTAMLQVHQKATVACSVDKAKQQPLTEAGFQEISKTCCYEDIKVFTRRLIDDMGLKVCDEGGLSGIAPFYSCPLSPITFAELKDEVKKAMPNAESKCHWLQDRYSECIEPALECSVSAQKPPPAPQPVVSGFLAMKVANPSEMMRSSKAEEVLKQELANELGVSTRNVNVVIGSGPLDGEEVIASMFMIPRSQAFYSLRNGVKQCKVFAVYSVQDSAPRTSSIATPPPTIDAQAVTDKLKHLNTIVFGQHLSQDLAEVDKAIGAVQVMEETVCENESKKCTHEVIREF